MEKREQRNRETEKQRAAERQRTIHVTLFVLQVEQILCNIGPTILGPLLIGARKRQNREIHIHRHNETETVTDLSSSSFFLAESLLFFSFSQTFT